MRTAAALLALTTFGSVASAGLHISTEAFRELLAQRTNTPNFERLASHIKEMEAEVRAAAEAWYAKARGL